MTRQQRKECEILSIVAMATGLARGSSMVAACDHILALADSAIPRDAPPNIRQIAQATRDRLTS